MAIVGHFKNISECEKLVQSKLLLPGVVQEIYKSGTLIPRLPVFAIDSLSMVWNRQKTQPEADFYDIGEEIPWKNDMDYKDQVEVKLKRVARAEVLDHFELLNYRNPNDLKAQILSELVEGCKNTIEDRIIYGDSSSDPKQFDGIIKLVDSNMRAPATGSGAGALNLMVLRKAIDSVKPKPDLIVLPYELQRRFDAMLFESGISAKSLVRVATDKDGLGDRVTYFDGIPMLPSDYLVAEDNTGTAKWSSGTKYYSIWLIRFGQLREGGLCMAVGAGTGGADFFKVVMLDELENYDAGGIRLVAYCSLACGSTKSLYQIYGITDAVITGEGA